MTLRRFFKLFVKPYLSKVTIPKLTRQLSVLLAAGIPLKETLAAVAKQFPKTHIKSLMLAVRSLFQYACDIGAFWGAID